MIIIKYCILFIFIFFFGCNSTKSLKKEQSFLFLIKMKNFKHRDQGFLYIYNKKILVEIYSNGQSTVKLHIFKNKICIGGFKCLKPYIFNKKFLSKSYPRNILENIFRANPIFNKQNIKYNNQYFLQNIKSKYFDIEYIVQNRIITFKDKLNSIKIEIKNL